MWYNVESARPLRKRIGALPPICATAVIPRAVGVTLQGLLDVSQLGSELLVIVQTVEFGKSLLTLPPTLGYLWGTVAFLIAAIVLGLPSFLVELVVLRFMPSAPPFFIRFFLSQLISVALVDFLPEMFTAVRWKVLLAYPTFRLAVWCIHWFCFSLVVNPCLELTDENAPYLDFDKGTHGAIIAGENGCDLETFSFQSSSRANLVRGEVIEYLFGGPERIVMDYLFGESYFLISPSSLTLTCSRRMRKLEVGGNIPEPGFLVAGGARKVWINATSIRAILNRSDPEVLSEEANLALEKLKQFFGSSNISFK